MNSKRARELQLYFNGQWDELAEALLPFANRLARDFQTKHRLSISDLDELESIAAYQLGLAIDCMRSKQVDKPNPRGLVSYKINGALLDWLSDRINRQEINNVFQQEQSDDQPDPDHLLATDAYDPEARAQASETLTRLIDVADRYGLDRRIVVGRLEDKTLEEIATDCGVSISTVQDRLNRLQKLFNTRYA